VPAAEDLAYDAPARADLVVQSDRGLLARSASPAAAAPGGWRAAADAQPAHGKVVVSGDGGFVFSPAGGYTGPDAFTYHIEATLADGSVLKSPTRTVSLDIGGGRGARGAALRREGAGLSRPRPCMPRQLPARFHPTTEHGGRPETSTFPPLSPPPPPQRSAPPPNNAQASPRRCSRRRASTPSLSASPAAAAATSSWTPSPSPRAH
jgi:hypothetical protein